MTSYGSYGRRWGISVKHRRLRRVDRTRLIRLGAAIGFTVLGMFHLLFAAANIRFVERLPADLNVALEGFGAAIAGIALLRAALHAGHGGTPWRMLLVAGAFFLVTMIVSILTGASSLSMLVVAMFLPLLAGVGLVGERLRAAETEVAR